MQENKQAFVRELGELLKKYSREAVRELVYFEDSDRFEAVEIIYEDGHRRTVNVTADSIIAVMKDIARAML
jgi:hypothetical protein